MRLSKILKLNGMFASDVKSKLKAGQIKLDGDPVSGDLDLEVDPHLTKENLLEVGEFIYDNIVDNDFWYKTCMVIPFEVLGTCNVNNTLTEFMRNFHVVRISKKEMFVVKKA